MHTQPIWAILLLALIASGCSKDEMQAEASLEGEWEVTAITSLYGVFTDLSFTPTEVVEETGSLGIFSFMRDSMEFSFSRNDTLFVGSGPWTLTSEKVRSGFTRETVFTLAIEGHFLFEVGFGDGTRNAEKNATEATFISMPPEGFGVSIQMELEKM